MTVDMVSRAEFLILPGYVLFTTVRYDGSRCSEVSHKCVFVFCIVFWEGKIFQTGLLVYNAEAKNILQVIQFFRARWPEVTCAFSLAP